MIAFSVIPSIPGTFPSNSQSRPVVGTFTTPSGSTHPVSHPIVIQPSDQRLPPRVIMGVEGLTLPSDPAATVTVTVAWLVDSLGFCTLLQGLASHQAAAATTHVGVSTAITVIETIHGPGVPGHIAAVGGSVEPVVNASTSQEGESNIFMVVEDDDEIVKVGMAQGFTKIVEPKKEKVGPTPIPPHASRGQGMGGGASQGRPPRGSGKGPAVIPPITLDDPGAGDDDYDFLRDPCKGGEEELLFDDPNKGEGEDDEDNEDEDDEDEVQVVTPSNRSTSEGLMPFDPEIHDFTGYAKADIIKLQNTAFKDDMKYAKKVKGALLGLPTGGIPMIQQNNSSELFALRAPQKGKSENNDDDEEGTPKEADIHHLWLPFLQGNKALGDCPPSQFKPPGDWPKVYTP